MDWNSPLGIVRKGMSLERDGYNFYVQVAERAADERGRAMFLDLANQERDHLHLLWVEYLALEEGRGWLPFEEAMLGLVDRTDMVDVRIFAIAVLVQREVGGNLAEILEGLAQTIRKRFYLRRQLRVYTAQGRMTGYTLGVLPFAVGFLIYLMDPNYVGVLFTTPVGWVFAGSALFLQLVGVLWIRRIINIDY